MRLIRGPKDDNPASPYQKRDVGFVYRCVGQLPLNHPSTLSGTLDHN
jgi:hypothetical protein